MEDRHMILHDLNTMFNIQVKIPLAVRNYSVNDLIYNSEITSINLHVKIYWQLYSELIRSDIIDPLYLIYVNLYFTG